MNSTIVSPWHQRVAWSLFVLQFLAMAVFSAVEYHRYALGPDFSGYYQAWYLIAHGHWNPPETVFLVNHFWRDHCVLMMWVLAPLYWLFPHSLTLLWVQDAAGVGTAVIVWFIAQELWTQRSHPSRTRNLLNAILLVLLVFNPWPYFGNAFDFHTYTLGALTATASLYAFLKGRSRWGYLWAAATLLGGDVVSTYVLGLAITLAVLGPRGLRYRGVIVGAMCLGFLALFGVLQSHIPVTSAPAAHASTSSTSVGFLTPYAYIVGPDVPLTMSNFVGGFFLHPGRWMGLLWRRRTDMALVLAPTAGIGLASPWGIGVPLIALAQTMLPKTAGFTADFAQMFPVYAMTSLGTVAWVGRVAVRRRILGAGILGLVAANTMVWFLLWMPVWPAVWIPVPAVSARVLHQLKIPQADEVIASSGIVGRFSDRPWVYEFRKESLPLETPITAIILSATPHVNRLQASILTHRIDMLRHDSQARLILHKDSIWVFQYRRAPGQTALNFRP